jgi:hypothetical protein
MGHRQHVPIGDVKAQGAPMGMAAGFTVRAWVSRFTRDGEAFSAPAAALDCWVRRGKPRLRARLVIRC